MNLNEKYILLFEKENRYNIITGGRGSGKSFAVAIFILLLSLEKGHVIGYTRSTLTSSAKSIIPELKEKIELLKLEHIFEVKQYEIINKQSGSKIIFFGLISNQTSNTAKLKSIHGLTTVVVEEAEEIVDFDIFDKLNKSVRKKGITNRIILLLNPTTKTHWIYDRFFKLNEIPDGYNGEVNGTTYIHTTYLDNYENLDSTFIDDLEILRKFNPSKYDNVVMGTWLEKSEGVVFENWEIKDYIDSNDSLYGCDWGYSIDASTLIKVSINKNDRTIYVKEYVYETNLSTSNIIKRFQKYNPDNKLIVADSSELRLIDEVKDKGINIKPVKKGAGSILEGIKLMQDYKIYIDPTSENVITEFKNYCWKKNGEKPLDKYNHSIDAIRYAVTNYLKSEQGIYHFG